MTYEYVCAECGTPYNETRGINEEQKQQTCAADGCEGKLKRVFSAPPIQFKGSGFSSNRG